MYSHRQRPGTWRPRVGCSSPSILAVGSAGTDELKALLAEQLSYYRAVAPEYGKTAIPEVPLAELVRGGDGLIAALEEFRPAGDVLELACGPGTWTPHLLHHADALTVVDGAPEMLKLAEEKIADERVRFVQADLFRWKPDRVYDVVFFGFWLSHVPLERFEGFWALVDRCLKPGGRVAFADDGFREAHELVEGAHSSVIARRLIDRTEFRAIKVPHTPEGLMERLWSLGWDISVRYVGGPFFWGEGTRASRHASHSGKPRLPET